LRSLPDAATNLITANDSEADSKNTKSIRKIKDKGTNLLIVDSDFIILHPPSDFF
jgi:hypothetical protein